MFFFPFQKALHLISFMTKKTIYAALILIEDFSYVSHSVSLSKFKLVQYHFFLLRSF